MPIDIESIAKLFNLKLSTLEQITYELKQFRVCPLQILNHFG